MTNYSWHSQTSGNWNTGTLWDGSISGSFPNATTDTATIDPTGSTTYTITIAAASSFTVGALFIDDSDATIALGGTLSGGAVTIEAGTVEATNATPGSALNATTLTNQGALITNAGDLLTITATSVTNAAGGIISALGGAYLDIATSSQFTNAGQVNAAGALFIGNATGTSGFSNTGTLDLTTASSTLTLRASLTTAQLGTVINNGSAISFHGVLTNTGATFNASTGPFAGFILSSAILAGGTVIDGVASALTVDPSPLLGYSTIENATILGNFALTNGGTLLIAGATRIETSAGAAVGTIALGSGVDGTSVLEIDTTVSPGTIDFIGTGTTDLILDAPMTGGTIAAIGVADTIELSQLQYVSGATTTYDPSQGLLTVNSGDVTETIDIVNVPAGWTFDTRAYGPGDPDAFTGGATVLTVVACYAAGTRISTDRGEVAVEDLVVGDCVARALGGWEPIVWIGHRSIDCRRHPRPRNVWPVRVLANAFGPGLPTRDLLLSPDHAVYVDGVLIPICRLINETTIRQERVASVTYWHVELEVHDVIIAEGLPAESYLDTGNRDAFANGGKVVQVHPDFASLRWAADACAEIVVGGPVLARIRTRLARLADRSAPLRHAD